MITFSVLRIDNSSSGEIPIVGRHTYFAFGVDSNWTFSQTVRHMFMYKIQEPMGKRDISRVYRTNCQKYCRLKRMF